jgi:hypothetical protein
VGATLSSGITVILDAYLVRGADGSERTAEVLVLGPGTDPAATTNETPAPAAAG